MRVGNGTVSVKGSPTKLVAGTDPECDWRLLSVSTPVPLSCELQFSSDAGPGFSARFSVARGAKICVNARALDLSASTVDGSTVDVCIGLVNGDHEHTSNFLEIVGAGPDAVDTTTPPYANRVRLEVDDPTQTASTTLILLDATGTVRASVPVDLIPETGLWIGASKTQRVEAPAGVNWRLVYALTM